jgi:hypothetical protein
MGPWPQTNATRHTATNSPPAGWYPDPSGVHDLRFWNGVHWTTQVADGHLQSFDPPVASSRPQTSSASAIDPAKARHHRIVRRALWNVYAIPFTLILLTSSVSEVQSLGWVGAFDLVVSVPSLVALYLHVWDRKMMPSFWKPYAFAFIAWEVVGNVLVFPRVSGEGVGFPDLFGLVFFLPLYFALFKYAYRTWRTSEPA